MFINKYPYTDFHELNLDWIINSIKEVNKAFDEFSVVNSIKFKGVWDIRSQYPRWSIVDYNGVAYISTQDVPGGIETSNEKYWTQVANYTELFASYQLRVSELERTSVRGFDTALDLINSGGVNGGFAQTKGYTDIGDKGGARYAITAEKPKTSYLTLQNGLYAQLLPASIMNINCFGHGSAAFSEYETLIDSCALELNGEEYDLSDLNEIVLGTVIGNSSTIVLSPTATVKYHEILNVKDVTFQISNPASTVFLWDLAYPCRNFNMSNVKFINVGATDTSRSGTALRVIADNIDIDDIRFNGFVTGCIVNRTAGTKLECCSIKNVYGENMQLLLNVYGYIGTDFSLRLNNVNIDGVKLVNTPTQKASIGVEVGSDALLLECVKNFNVSNVESVYARERAIYCNMCENGFIDNVYAEGSQAVKVCGNASVGQFGTRISVTNIQGKELDNGYLLALYDVNTITARGLSCYNSIQTSSAMLELDRQCLNVDISNVTVAGSSRGLILLQAIAGVTNNLTNVRISHVSADRLALGRAYHAIRSYEYEAQGGKWIHGLMLDDIQINPREAYYNSVGPTGFIAISNAENVTIKNAIIRGVASFTPLSFSACSGVILEDISFLTSYRSGYIAPIAGVSDMNNVCGISYGGPSGMNYSTRSNYSSIYGGSAVQSVTTTTSGSKSVLSAAPCSLHITGTAQATLTCNGSTWTKLSGDASITVVDASTLSLPIGKFLFTYSF